MTTKALSLVVVLALLGGCGSKAPAGPAPVESSAANTIRRPAVSVRFARVERRALRGTIAASGEVMAGVGSQATLDFAIAGQIASVDVSVGDRVARGAILARLDGRIAAREIAQAEADAGAASAQLAKASAGARPQELAQNSALVTAAEAKARTASAELQRQQSLATVGIASRRDLELARASYADAVAQLRDKQQSGSLLLAGPRVQDVAVARAQLAQARAALATAQTRASLLAIVAPFDGVVSARMKGPGEVVDSTTNVLTIVDPTKAVIAVRLSEDQSASVAVGNRATVAINGSAATMEGVVKTVNASLDPTTRTLQALIEPLGAFALRPGATASATITVRTVGDAYVVPTKALVKDPDTGVPLVFAPLPGGTYRRIPVRVALQSGGFAAIVSPQLRTVSRVVTDGAYELLPFAVGGDKG